MPTLAGTSGLKTEYTLAHLVSASVVRLTAVLISGNSLYQDIKGRVERCLYDKVDKTSGCYCIFQHFLDLNFGNQ